MFRKERRVDPHLSDTTIPNLIWIIENASNHIIKDRRKIM
jgi:hypothetical protein